MSGFSGEPWPGAVGDRFEVVLLGGDAEMAEAVALARGRVVARPGWGEPVADAGALVVVDLVGGGEAALARLTDLAARAALVVCDFDQLDVVAGAMLWTDAQLLCAPSMAERVAALAMAAAEAAAPEAVREGEAARLQRFGSEVARIAEVLARLAAETGPVDLADRRSSFDPGLAVAVMPPDPQAIRQAVRARRLRAGFFGDGLFEDPAWDMLLDLFAAELEGTPVSVSSLCIAAHVAPTTALRWIGRLTEAGLFQRRADPQDRRRAFVALTAAGSTAMHRYLAALARQGVALT